MKTMKNSVYVFLVCFLFFTSCTTTKPFSGNYPHEIECMGTELDGSVTLKTWGKGKNRADAIEQAKKEAVNAVLFVNIRNGKPDCDTRPIFNLPNIRANKADYFNNFFKDGGEYVKFISNKDETFGKKESAQATDGNVMFGMIIRVMKSELKKQMIADGILTN
jgi:hypothetical protein